MSNVEIKLNKAGVRELLRSDWIMGICQEHASRIAQNAGTGYGTDAYTGKNRVNVSVFPEEYSARKDNLEHNTLLKALGR